MSGHRATLPSLSYQLATYNDINKSHTNLNFWWSLRDFFSPFLSSCLMIAVTWLCRWWDTCTPCDPQPHIKCIKTCRHGSFDISRSVSSFPPPRRRALSLRPPKRHSLVKLNRTKSINKGSDWVHKEPKQRNNKHSNFLINSFADSAERSPLFV